MAIPSRFLLLWSVLSLIGLLQAQNGSMSTQSANWPVTDEVSCSRSFFYVGGQYVTGPQGTLFNNAQYVEVLKPQNPTKSTPIVLMAGGAVTGVQYLNKPDGKPGWASHFLGQGYTVYIVDWYSTGRSADTSLPMLLGASPVELVEKGFTAPENYKQYYQAQFHTQWPGTGLKGDPAFDAFYATFRPLTINFTLLENNSRTSTCALLERIGPSIVVTHSIGSSAAWVTTDKCPSLVKGHVAVDSDTSPFASYDNAVSGALNGTTSQGGQIIRPYGLTFTPITFSPAISSPADLKTTTTGKLEKQNGLLSAYPCIVQASPARKLVNLARTPVLFLVGEASVIDVYGRCMAEFLQQGGVPIDYVRLGEQGIKGNGHFPMLEQNSDDIAKLMQKWIERGPGSVTSSPVTAMGGTANGTTSASSGGNGTSAASNK